MKQYEFVGKIQTFIRNCNHNITSRKIENFMKSRHMRPIITRTHVTLTKF